MGNHGAVHTKLIFLFHTQVNFAFFITNCIWLVATFTLQLFDASFSIRVPKLDVNLQDTGEDVQIDPIGFMFILGFATSVTIQFLTMFYHRINTLIHYVAFLDTEGTDYKIQPVETYKPPKKVSKKMSEFDSISDTKSNFSVATTADEDFDDESDFEEESDDEFYEDIPGTSL